MSEREIAKAGVRDFSPIIGIEENGLILPQTWAELFASVLNCKSEELFGDTQQREKEILLRMATLSTQQLPKDFLLSDVCQRVWEAFHLGREYRGLEQ